MNGHRLLCALALVAQLATAPSVAAQGPAMAPSTANVQPHGFVVERPGGGAVSPRNGLHVRIDSRWLNNYGYRPLRVRVTSPKPATRDYEITVRLYVAPWVVRAGNVVVVEEELELPLGQTSAEAIIRCPQFQTGQRFWWDVRVNGVRDETLSVETNVGWQLTAAGATPPDEATLKFLVVSPNVPEPASVPVADAFEAVAISPEDLPTKWIDFTAVDVIAITPDQLEHLANRRGGALLAIRRWVRAGGQLWVSPVGDEWENLELVERLLGLAPSTENEPTHATRRSTGRETDAQIAARGWKPIPIADRRGSTRMATFLHLRTGRSRTVRDAAMIDRLKNDPDWMITDERDGIVANQPGLAGSLESEGASGNGTDKAADGTIQAPADSAQWYVERTVGLGSVRVFRRAWDVVGFGISWRMLLGFGPPDPAAARTPLAAAVESTRGWESRHGMTPDTANADFANWLVPGVGLAPVTEFRVLITLFVLVIGPLNYWLLLRSGRLYLLVLTVPLVAVLMTGALLGYALLLDGFGTTVRVRSFTSLDQRSGEAACWARLSYYAGLAPSGGLLLPDDVAVYPIRAGWIEAGSGASLGANRTLLWADGEQRLTEGWLRSRTPTQYLTVRARQSPHRLAFKSAKGTMTAHNKLGTAIRYLAVADQDGAFFAGEAIAEGATATLAPTTDVDILRQLRQLVAANEPETPIELAVSDVVQSTSRPRRRYRRYELEYGLERLDGNLQSGAIDMLVGTGNRSPLDLPPRSYVAITETGPEVVLGLPHVREDASFHVLVGYW